MSTKHGLEEKCATDLLDIEMGASTVKWTTLHPCTSLSDSDSK